MLTTDNFRASLWMVGSMALFALEDLFLKKAAQAWPTGQLLLVFGVAGILFWGGIARLYRIPLMTARFWHPAVGLRNLGEATAAMAWITALAVIPLATASAILQSAPLMVTMGAALVLGEQVGWRRWSAIAVGMAGVLMILQPGPEGWSVMALVAVASVVFLTIRDLATRRIPADVATLQLTGWAYLMLIPSGLVLLLWEGRPVAPLTGPVAVSLLAAFVTGAAGYYAVVYAMRIGEASAVAPFRYARMVFALILAILVLGERPGPWVLGGAALVVASGLYTFARSRVRKPRPVAPSPAPGDGV